MIAIHSVIASVTALVRGRLPKDTDRGATAVEYGLMVALIAAVIAGIVLTLGGSLHDKFSNVNTCVQTTATCPGGN
jgi:pilus assembly protein Flp/PilA